MISWIEYIYFMSFDNCLRFPTMRSNFSLVTWNIYWLAQSESNIRTDLRPRPDQTRPNPTRPDQDLLISQLWTVLEGWNFEGTSSSVKNPYSIKDQDYKLQSGASSILQSPKWGLKGHGCSLHLQNQDREPKFSSGLYQRPVIIFKSKSRCQNQVRNLQHHLKPQMRT